MSWEPAAPDLRDNGHKILLVHARDRLSELLTETGCWDGSPLRYVREQVASSWFGQACGPFLEALNVADTTWRAAVLDLHLATEERVRTEDDLIDVANRPHEAWKADGVRLAQSSRWGSR